MEENRKPAGVSDKEKRTPGWHRQECEDHLGNRYESIKQMLHAYGVSAMTYYYRLKKGWTLKEVLTVSRRKGRRKACVDHLGNKYASVKQMLRAYNISFATYYQRLGLGWSLKETLTTPINKKGKLCTDHLGNTYRSISEMCRAHGVNYVTYMSRLRKNPSDLEGALSPEDKRETLNKTANCRPCTDHLGNKYVSISEMCKTYGISLVIYDKRRERGHSLAEALETPVKKRTCTDHLGNEFKNIPEMCKAYGINVSAFRDRIRKGKSLEEALTRSPFIVYDHKGNEFPDIGAMCKAYGISYECFRSRKRYGWDIERALTEPMRKKRT